MKGTTPPMNSGRLGRLYCCCSAAISFSSSPVISQDGRFITYLTEASNLGGLAGVYRYDAQSGTNMYLPSSSLTFPPSMSLPGRTRVEVEMDHPVWAKALFCRVIPAHVTRS